VKRKKDPRWDAAELRRQAERRLRDRLRSQEPERKSTAEVERLLHELQVHQIELEIQNEELHGARAELETALDKYLDLYELAPVGYLTLGPEGNIREANLAGAKLLGIERSALVTRRFEHFLSAADLPVFSAFLEQVFAKKVLGTGEVTILREGTPAIDIEMDAVVFESGQACRLTLVDVTERKRAERSRLIMNKLESTGILAGGIAHDFNNLLTIIILNLDLAEKLPAGRDSACRLAAAKAAAWTSRGLTQQLIAFSEGGAPIRKLISLSDLIRRSVTAALFGSLVRCEFSLAADLLPAEVDAGQLAQVLRNLVLNAKEAMPQGGVVHARAKNVALCDGERSSLPDGEYVRISIADHGPGISKDALPKIFDPYFSTKEKGDQKGMGLGLSICHAVIDKHRGAITVDSESGAGTAFHILLPASQEPISDTEAAYGT
jgi:two-component system cell cycle sensor histidine kinase/response regulator CckA